MQKLWCAVAKVIQIEEMLQLLFSKYGCQQEKRYSIYKILYEILKGCDNNG